MARKKKDVTTDWQRWSSEFIKFYSEFDGREKEMLNHFLYQSVKWLPKGLELCQSPIERLMLIALMNLEFDLLVLSDDFRCCINQQYPVTVGDKTYHVDFMISMQIKGKIYNLVIECDGHDFHEKTKEQVRKDKARERDITLKGYGIMRFSGSEIWENPFECVKQVYTYFFNFHYYGRDD